MNKFERASQKNPLAKRSIAALRFVTPLLLLGICVFGAPPAVYAQTDDSLEELKESLKKELLEELRKELLAPSESNQEMQELRDSLKREILQDLKNEQTQEDTEDANMRNQLKQEILNDLKETHPQAVAAIDGGAGDVEGKMLRAKKSLPDCRVKLVRLSGSSTKFFGFTENEEFITTTNSDGVYVFEGLPPGNYKIKWELPGDTGWIRRLRDSPDLTVAAGRRVTVEPIETARPLVPQS